MEYPVGEVPTETDPRAFNGKWTRPTSARGGHLCHPDWFVNGQPWPLTIPETEYNSEGIPICCCVEQYSTRTDEFVVMTPPSAAFACQQWLGVGPVTGKPFRLIAQGADPVASPWRLLRRRNGLPTFLLWICSAPWNGRGVSPVFFADDPFDPDYPVVQLHVREVV